MDVIDDEGFIFGVVNIVDALVVLMVLAVLTAGVSLVLGTGSDSFAQTVTVRTSAQPDYVANSIKLGPVPTDGIIAIENKSIASESDGKVVLELRVKLAVSTTTDGLSNFEGDRLYVGRQLELDLGSTIVQGVVVDMGQRTKLE